MSAVLIAGCGDVGGELARRLLADGYTVYGLRRRTHLLPEGVQPVAGDVSDPLSLQAMPAGIDLLCYTAAADARSAAAYRAAYVDGPRNVLRAVARTSSPRRVLFASSTRVYPQSAGEWVDEGSSTGGDDPYATLLLEGEAAVRDAAASSVVVRLAGIYGPGRTRLIDRVRAGEPCGAAWTNRIHRDDSAGVLRHLLRLERPLPLYLAADGEPATQCAVMAWMAERLGLPAPPTADAGDGSLGKRCRNAHLVASGYEFEYPSFREGYRAVIADLAARGKSPAAFE
ncbi:MAG: NAD-dependent epimerase/dehydratase family protein [Acidobacteriota bacterium]|nr:NAD-dependent epimerase/dehydratase family protein [Acidobacteriota bacterium]